MYEIRIAGREVWFYVEGRRQHTWDTGDLRCNMRAARAYLQAVKAEAVDVQEDGVSGWWSIEDDLRSSNFKI